MNSNVSSDGFPPQDGLRGFVYYTFNTLFFGLIMLLSIFVLVGLTVPYHPWAVIITCTLASFFMTGSGYYGTQITGEHTLVQAVCGGVGSCLLWLGVYFYLSPYMVFEANICFPIFVVGAAMFFHFAISPHPPIAQSEPRAA